MEECIQTKIRFDSKDEFDAWIDLYKNSTRFHSFAEDQPWEYPCIITVVEVTNDFDSVNDVYYNFVYKRNFN